MGYYDFVADPEAAYPACGLFQTSIRIDMQEEVLT